MQHTWEEVALTLIAALPGVIAALSSLKNGRTLKNGASAKPPKKKTSNGASKDWYKAPDL